MIGVMDLIANGGNLPALIADAQAMSPRKKGVKRGLFIFLLAFLVVPLITIFSIMVNARPYAVVISAIILTVGGLLRMAYAMMFESNTPDENLLEANALQIAQNFLSKKKKTAELPPQQSILVDVYASPVQTNWLDTNDLPPPASVTDNTTKLLQKEEQNEWEIRSKK